jgi:hypothetical protein
MLLIGAPRECKITGFIVRCLAPHQPVMAPLSPNRQSDPLGPNSHVHTSGTVPGGSTASNSCPPQPGHGSMRRGLPPPFCYGVYDTATSNRSTVRAFCSGGPGGHSEIGAAGDFPLVPADGTSTFAQQSNFGFCRLYCSVLVIYSPVSPDDRPQLYLAWKQQGPAKVNGALALSEGASS